MNRGWFDIAGFGRQAFAYPITPARDIISGKGMQRNKCCSTCDKCYDLIQIGHTTTGCVVRDQEVYLPLYRSKVQKKRIARKKRLKAVNRFQALWRFDSLPLSLTVISV